VNKERSEGGAEQDLELAEWSLGGQALGESTEVKGNLKKKRKIRTRDE
jgi:hypothetical protein